MNLAALIAKAATTFPDRPAICVGRAVWADYRALARQAAAIAGAIHESGLVPGDRVALAMSNSPEYLPLLIAIWWQGLCAVPINAKLHAREFEYILSHCGAKLCFATPDLAETVAPLADEIPALANVILTGSKEHRTLLAGSPVGLAENAPDDLAWIFYTSGTTGRPKGAMLSHRNLLTMALSYLSDVDSISTQDTFVHAAPLSHGSGLYAIPFLAKGATHVLPESGHYDPAEMLDLIAAWPNVSSFLAPTMVTRLLSSPALANASTENLKTIVYGGGPMYVSDLKQALDIFGPKLAQIYGQGESPMTITALSKAVHAERDHPDWEERLASAGLARTDVEVRVVDEEDRPLPPGETGEIVVRGDVVMQGYLGDPKATADALRGGWLHTGDVGAFNQEGFLTLKDRAKDLIISGGSNIYPREVEDVLLRHPGVLEVSVVGAPHADWGEEVVAFVVPRPDAQWSSQELDQLCLDHIGRFKRPKRYIEIASLPKNNYGKILKTELRKRFDTN